MLKLYYNRHSPVTSINWGVFIPVTWGREILARFRFHFNLIASQHKYETQNYSLVNYFRKSGI